MSIYVRFNDRSVRIVHADGHQEDAKINGDFFLIQGLEMRVLMPATVEVVTEDARKPE